MSKLLVVAGEESGDKHAAKLIAEILQRDPSCEIRAAGGERMAEAGADLRYNLVELAVLGSVEVLRNYAGLRRIFHGLLSLIEEWRPDAVVLVDREQGGVDALAKQGINVHAVLSMRQILERLQAQGLIDQGTLLEVKQYLDGAA